MPQFRRTNIFEYASNMFLESENLKNERKHDTKICHINTILCNTEINEHKYFIFNSNFIIFFQGCVFGVTRNVYIFVTSEVDWNAEKKESNWEYHRIIEQLHRTYQTIVEWLM